MKNKLLTTLVTLTLMIAGLACNDQQAQNAKSFSDILAQGTGDQYVTLKVHTEVSGYSVFQDTTTGAIVAYNISKFDPKTMTTLAQYLAVANSPNDVVTGLYQNTVSTYIPGYYDYYYDSYGNYQSYYVPGYTETDTYYQNNYFTFENKRTSSKDLENVIANASKVDASAMQAALTAQYGFSEERAAKVATLTKQMKQVSGSRELTDADKDVFTKSALGVDYKSLSDSLKQSDSGDQAAYQRLVQQAAQTNGTTPEQSRQLIEDMAGQSL